MLNVNHKMFDLMSQYLSKSDIYAATAKAKVSAFILKRRNEMHMTQKEFAKMMGVSQTMVSKWESVEYNFSLDNIAEIAEKLNMTFDIDFIPESEYLYANANNQYESVVTKEMLCEKFSTIDFNSAA